MNVFPTNADGSRLSESTGLSTSSSQYRYQDNSRSHLHDRPYDNQRCQKSKKKKPRYKETPEEREHKRTDFLRWINSTEPDYQDVRYAFHSLVFPSIFMCTCYLCEAI